MQLISASNQLSATLPMLLEPKYRTQLGNFLNLGQKSPSCPFWLKISTYGILEVLILNPDLGFLNSKPKIHFLAKFGRKKEKFSLLTENWHTWYLEDADSYSNIRFLKFQT